MSNCVSKGVCLTVWIRGMCVNLAVCVPSTGDAKNARKMRGQL